MLLLRWLFCGCGSKDEKNSDETVNISDNEIKINSKDEKIIEQAVKKLKKAWKKVYNENQLGDGYLEIKNTRIVWLKSNLDDRAEEFFDGTLKNCECIVEFEIYTDFYGTSPYYTNPYMYNNVLYSDGKYSVKSNVLRMYTSSTYSYDYSGIIKSVTDYKGAFNETFDLIKKDYRKASVNRLKCILEMH